MDQKTPSPPETTPEIERKCKVEKTARKFGETIKERKLQIEQEKVEQNKVDKQIRVREMMRKMEGSSRKYKRDKEINSRRLLQDAVLDWRVAHGAHGEGHDVPPRGAKTSAGKADGQFDQGRMGPHGDGTGGSEDGDFRPEPGVQDSGGRDGGPPSGAAGGDGGDYGGEEIRLAIGSMIEFDEGTKLISKTKTLIPRGKLTGDKVTYRGADNTKNVLMDGRKLLVHTWTTPEPSTRRMEPDGLYLGDEMVAERRDEH